MGDDKRSPPFQKFLQTFLQNQFRLRIDAGSRFVQNQDFRVGEQGSRKGDQLPLSRGKAASPFIDLRFISVFHLHDKIMCAHSLRRTDNFFICCFHIAITYVIHNRAGKYKTVLHHDTHLLPQRADGHSGNIDVIDINMAGVHIVETAE